MKVDCVITNSSIKNCIQPITFIIIKSDSVIVLQINCILYLVLIQINVSFHFNADILSIQTCWC